MFCDGSHKDFPTVVLLKEYIEDEATISVLPFHERKDFTQEI